MDVDNEKLLSLATDSIQSHTRLHNELRAKKHILPKAFEDSAACVSTLCNIKAELDGSLQGFKPPVLQENDFVEFKQLTLMHVPGSLKGQSKEKFQQFINNALIGSCQKVLCAALVTCPWYQLTQKELGEQARHNVVYVVYLSHDHQLLAPIGHHELEKAFVKDYGWLYAVELSHFLHSLSIGKARALEFLYCPTDAVIFKDACWDSLLDVVNFADLMRLPGFLEACKGQSAGAVGKKGKSGKFQMRDTATFGDFCDSFKLLHHLQNLVNGLPLCCDVFDPQELPPLGKQGFSLLQQMHQTHDVQKSDIFETLMSWRSELLNQLSEIKRCNNKDLDTKIGHWQCQTRLQGRQILSRTVADAELAKLTSLMEMIGGPVKTMHPSQIILVAQAGSHMYGLSTPQSDVDYIVIYAEKTEDLLSATKMSTGCFESRGPTKDFEYGAYEARVFADMLLKGSVVILELLYTLSENEFMSPAWQELREKRVSFVTEWAIQQYIGLMRNNFSQIKSGKHAGTGREKKLFYQIFHKLDSVKYMMQGLIPPVQCQGQVKDFIMKIRTQPLEGDFERDTLHHKALEDFDSLLSDLANRKQRLKEFMDYNLVSDWLINIRGIGLPES